jgi:hypothetical protein
MPGREKKMPRRFGWENLKEGAHFEELGIYWRLILQWILSKWNLGAWKEFSGWAQGSAAGSCEYNNETSGSIKCRKFLI